MENMSDESLMKNSRLALIHKRGYRPDLSRTEVDDALSRLCDILGVTISTIQTYDLGAGRLVFAAFAERGGKAVTFRGKYGYGITGDWKAVVSLAEWNSRYSFLKYALEQAVQMFTDEQVLDTIYATTVDELALKAGISDGLKWRSRNAHDPT